MSGLGRKVHRSIHFYLHLRSSASPKLYGRISYLTKKNMTYLETNPEVKSHVLKWRTQKKKTELGWTLIFHSKNYINKQPCKFDFTSTIADENSPSGTSPRSLGALVGIQTMEFVCFNFGIRVLENYLTEMFDRSSRAQLDIGVAASGKKT